MGNFYVILLHLCCSLNCANALAASTVSPFWISLMPTCKAAWSWSSVMVSAFRAAGAFGRDSEKGMPPVRVIWRRYISMAVAIGMPSCFRTSSACCLTVGFTRRLSVIVFSMVITSILL